MGIRLTIFTPAYNRAELLKRAYESLCAQSRKDFVWLIVDDGSEDGTKEEVAQWIEEGKIRIRYFWQENGGKMRAHNRGVKECETPLFVCLDSDDYFTKTAVDDILNRWESLADREHYAGIIAHKGSDEAHTLYGAMFPDHGDTTLRGLYRKGFKGETTLIIRTDLLKKHPFPEIPGEKYVPEDVVYDRIDRHHVYAVLPRILTVCEIVQSGYTDRVHQLRRENPTGWLIYYSQRARSTPMSVLKLKYASHYLRFEKLAVKTIRKEYPLPAGMRILGIPGAFLLRLKGKL